MAAMCTTLDTARSLSGLPWAGTSPRTEDRGAGDLRLAVPLSPGHTLSRGGDEGSSR